MSAIQQILIDHIDIWTTAETEKKSGRGRSSGNGVSVYGIKKLRELILELAVRGKLVPQDPNDEPTSELIKRVQAEKAKLIAEGKIKKDKPLPPILEEKKPFELPHGWEWVSVSKLTLLITDGTHHTPNYLDTGVPFISVKDIDGNTISFSDCKYISEKEHLEINLRCNPERDDILLCRIGTLGRPTIVDTDRSFSLFVSVGLLKLPKTVKLHYYCHLVLSSPLMYSQYDKIKAGGSHTNKLNLGDIPRLLLPTPPLAEQHRIVAKVDELMALCDQLETQHNNAAEAHEKLVSHLLGTLTQSQSAADFSANWQRIAAHFDTLFNTETSIDALKQTLLQLAVMGKLVPQDPNDEPASELLKRIQAEKAKLIAEGKIKKDKPLPPISDEEKPFELPQGWEWVRLGELASLITKGSSPKWQGVRYTDNLQDVMFVTSENVGSYSLLLDAPKYVEKKFNDIEPRSILSKGDYLMNIVGASIGRTAVYNIDVIANINQAVCLIRILSSNLLSMFLLHFFNSETCLEYMFDKQVDNARPNLSMGNITKFLIPIPPIEEQHRIVAKVDELMALCEQLKSRITAASQLQQKLANVVVERAIAS